MATTNEPTTRFRYKVAERATAQGLDQSKLSRKADVSLPAIRRYWHDKVQRPDLAILGKIAQALGTTVEEIMSIESDSLPTDPAQ